MIYKLEDAKSGNILECSVNESKTGAIFSVSNLNTTEDVEFLDVEINEFQLFQLIGALHTIQKQLQSKKSN